MHLPLCAAADDKTFRVIVDIILIAQGEIAFTTLLPEMVYFAVMCGVLIRFFPMKPKEKITEDKKDFSETKSDKLPKAEDLGEIS